jgi:hypothetical protein
MKTLTTTILLTILLSLTIACGAKHETLPVAHADVVASGNANRVPYGRTPAAPGHKCGAITKSGKPCERQVRDGREHCWQHEK